MNIFAALCRFIQEIYGGRHTRTFIEVDVEVQSGGIQGTPHLEVTSVRVYAEGVQLLPDFEMPNWKAILTAYPDLFQECATRQDRLDAVQELLQRERLYQEYGLDWPHADGMVVAPLRFTIEQLHHLSLIGEPYTCTPLTGHTASIKTPFRLPNGKPINFEVFVRNGQFILRDDGEVLRFLFLLCAEELLPLHVYLWVPVICAEQRVQAETGRFLVQLRKGDDWIGAIQRLIATILHVAALRYLLVPPEG